MSEHINVAVMACTEIYNKLAPKKIYPALTGGTLYKAGRRKDIDIVLYRGDAGGTLNLYDFRYELLQLGYDIKSNHGRVVKAQKGGFDFDFILPEAEGGEYPTTEERVYTTELPRIVNFLSGEIE